MGCGSRFTRLGLSLLGVKLLCWVAVFPGVYALKLRAKRPRCV